MGQFFGVIFVDHESGLTEMEQVSKSISKFIESWPDYYLGSPAGEHYRVHTPLNVTLLSITIIWLRKCMEASSISSG